MDKAHMVGRAKRKNTCSNFLFKHCTSLALENDMSRPGDKAYTNSILLSVADCIKPVRLSANRDKKEINTLILK